MGLPQLIQRRGAVHQPAASATTGEEYSGGLGVVVPQSVLDLVPESVARENLIFPISVNGETLTCYSANSNDILLRDKLSFVLNKKIQLVPAHGPAIGEEINRHYGCTEYDGVDSMLASNTRLAFGDYFAESRFGRIAALAINPLRNLGERVIAHKKGINGSEDEFELLDEDDGTSERLLGLKQSGRDTSSQWSLSGPPRWRQGQDTTEPIWEGGMFFYTVQDGQRVLVIHRNGQVEVVTGPARVLQWGKTFRQMAHFVAHPGDFLVVRFRDGRQDHLTGPADIWFDPRVHMDVQKQEGLQVAAKEAVVVYSRAAETATVTRRIVSGPTLFVPAPGEWLHTFTWHGSEGGSAGVQKVAKGLVFQKLWLMPDQMYHDVTDVRTADDAVLMLRLMIFFELIDIERMLEATHDPIGDFINAATSDVVDFTGHRTFEAFKHETGKLNELETYRQLTARAVQNGYRINKVVYRGYGAPDRLQAMHDQAIEARTKLQLERATEQQAQELEDDKLNAQMARATKRRTEQAIEVDSEIGLARKRQEAELRQKETERDAVRQQRVRDAEVEQEIRRQSEERTRQHLAALKDMNVDLTAFLTQGRADRVIELRGGAKGGTHVHLDGVDGDRTAS